MKLILTQGLHWPRADAVDDRVTCYFSHRLLTVRQTREVHLHVFAYNLISTSFTGFPSSCMLYVVVGLYHYGCIYNTRLYQYRMYVYTCSMYVYAHLLVDS